QSLVTDAYARVPFHRRRFAEAGMTPDDVRTLADLSRLPTTPKDLLRRLPASELVATGVDPDACDVVRTSGSTGMPLRILRGRLVISDGEPLVPTTRALVARAFGTVPFDVYGLVELSNFAWECERHDGLHVSADTHLVEIVGDDGRPVPPGTPGRIVCTDL